jgi:ankyrin repeat protein
LLVAAVGGHTALALLLLKNGADANRDDAGYTPLHWAAHSMETELVGPFGLADESNEWGAIAGLRPEAKKELLAALLAHGANPNARLQEKLPEFGFKSAELPGGLNLKSATPFLLAAKAGDVSSMRLLLAHGADPRLTTTDNNTALILAAGYGRIIGQSIVTESRALEAVNLALETGADVNAANEAGDTALHGAAYQGWNEIARLLVARGANVNAKNTFGETPLFIAEGNVYHSGAYTVHPSTAELLKSLGGISQGNGLRR